MRSDLARFLPALVLAVGVLLISGAKPQRSIPIAVPLAQLDLDMEGYVASDIPIGEEEQRVAGMTTYLHRSMSPADTASGGFTVYVGYYDRQLQGRTIHSPKNCLPGSGWQVLESATRPVATSTGTHVVNRYTLTNGSSQAVVYYWYQGRGRVVASEYVVKWNLLRDSALLGRSDEALVRVVVPLAFPAGGGGEAGERADAIATAAAAQLIPELARVLPAREWLAMNQGPR